MLRSSDVFVLAALCLQRDDWTQAAVAQSLGLSQSSINRALKQLRTSGLWRGHDGGINRTGASALFIHGLKYVYPAELGAPTRGLPTAHSGPGFAEVFPANETYVWPYEAGDMYGIAVSPIHSSVPPAAAADPRLHALMATLDVLRLGRARERRVAESRLAEILSPQ